MNSRHEDRWLKPRFSASRFLYRFGKRAILLSIVLLICGAGGPPLWRPTFRNIGAGAGLAAAFPNGGDTSKEFILETTGSGIAIFDYDNDGLPDIFVVSGPGGTNRLYHNEGHDRFRDVTAAMGLESDGWGQGVCVGDYDNDGFTDLFVTYFGQNHLYRNVGGKRFEDVTEQAHLIQDRARYNTGCAFLDIDNDGHLDLFVSNYVRFDFESAPRPGDDPYYCSYAGIPVACGPRGLPLDRNILYRNNGDDTFKDISQESGIVTSEGHYSLGVVVSDFNNDGLPDIYVACDQTPSLLFINQGNGKFMEEALQRGVGLGESGQTLSGMGVDVADYDGSGNFSIFQSNFSGQLESLYQNKGDGRFENVAMASGLGVNTSFVGWGAGFFDYDNDGWPDLLLVNGHVYPELELHSGAQYKQRAILYHNQRNGKFLDVSEQSGPGIAERHASRGAAFGDLDNDGSIEVAINNQNEPPSLLKLTSTSPNHWIILKLEGTRSNRSAIGARVELATAGHAQVQEVRSGGSYLSQNDLRLHFGLGQENLIPEIRVRWPSGTIQKLKQVPADQVLAIREP